jgi:hypothetical protein
MSRYASMSCRELPMDGYASMKSAAMDGRFLTFAFRDERTRIKAKRSEHEIYPRAQTHQRRDV